MPYTRSIDWWCLGAVTYEMVYGLPPFYSRNTDEMYQGILYKPLKLNSSISLVIIIFIEDFSKHSRFTGQQTLVLCYYYAYVRH